MVEAIAETDEDLTLKYLEEDEIGLEELMAALRKATLASELVPVLCGSSLKNKGVQPLLDAVIHYLPSPQERPPITGMNPATEEPVVRHPDFSEPMTALVFKIITDPYVGRLAYVRVYSGILHSGEAMLNVTRGRKERIGRLMRIYAEKREEMKEIGAGDIAAIIGLKQSFTGETLSDPSDVALLEAITFPEPVISVAIEPRTKGDQDKLADALNRLSDEDPTFKVRVDENTGQTLIAGMGELHLEVLVDRMIREFRVNANIGKPQVAYRETITNRVDTEGRFVRQSGGRGQYGHVKVVFEPLDAAADSSSWTRWSAAQCRVSTSVRSKQVSARRWKAASWAAIPLSMSRLRCMMVRTTRSILRKWHSGLPVRWPCAMAFLAASQLCWNLSLMSKSLSRTNIWAT